MDVAARGYLGVVKYLINGGANLNAKDKVLFIIISFLTASLKRNSCYEFIFGILLYSIFHALTVLLCLNGTVWPQCSKLYP